MSLGEKLQNFFHFSRYIGNLSNQRASLLSTYKDAFKNTICSTWAKFFKISPSTYKEACKNAFSITHFLDLFAKKSQTVMLLFVLLIKML